MKKLLLLASILMLVASAFAFNPRPFITQLQIADGDIMEYVDVPGSAHQAEFKVQVIDVSTGDMISTDTHHVSLARVSSMPGPGGLPAAFLTFDCQGFPTLGNVPEGREFTVVLTYLPIDAAGINPASRTVIAPAGASPVWSYGDEGSWQLPQSLFEPPLTVTSNYSAHIFQDGINTGFFTPHTFSPGQRGVYHLELDGYTWEPTEITVDELIEDTSIDFVGTPHLPEISSDIPFVSMLMNSSYVLTELGQYFETYSRNPDYSVTGNTHISWSLSDVDEISLAPQTNWYGTEYINIRATNPIGYTEQVVKVTVFETWLGIENFDHTGALAAGWTVQHSGSTAFPWQPVLHEGEDYLMKTMAGTGGTVNERLLSPIYNLSDCKDVQISFDSDFLPYGAGSGTFAYSLNNITYTVVETYTTAHSGRRTYTIPALDAKPSVRFRWLYSNATANTGQDNRWAIDNLSIFGMVPPPPPDPVSGFTLQSQENDSALFAWDPYSTTYFGSFELYVSSDSEVTTADQLWSVTEDPALIYEDTSQSNIAPLVDGEYWIGIRVLDQNGTSSPWSGPVYVKIDTTPPQIFAPIPANQPEPAWTLRDVGLGCTISDFSPIGMVEYRYDSNGNGSYDPEEIWQVLDLDTNNQGLLEIMQPVTFEADGIFHFEFRATDAAGNVAYSGMEGSEGIEDDWIVRIDATAPLFIDPVPENQPDPDWHNSLTIDIGATIQDLNAVNDIMYRYDANRNGSYDVDEIWQTLPRNLLGSTKRSSTVISLPVTVPGDGIYHFEFKAMDILGNTGFSGTQGLEGIEDDWSVKIDTLPPLFAQPIPANQPLPAWSDSADLTIGATISDFNGVDAGTIMYRIDENQNGIYDPQEIWQAVRTAVRSGSRNTELSISIPVSVTSDGVYKFEIKAADLSGKNGYSGSENLEGIEDDWLFRVDSTPPSAIASFFVEEVYDDSILLSWSASADENFTAYRIYYSTQENVSETDALWDSEDDPLLVNAGEGLVSTTITGLLSSTRYYFVLQAIDEVGWISQYPEFITGMTGSSYPPMMPQNLMLLVSGNDLLLNWDDVTTDTFGNPIEISYYEVHVSDEPYFECSVDTLVDSMEESELSLEGVAEYADRLFFKVIAISGAIRLRK
jgi:hypothetical protein